MANVMTASVERQKRQRNKEELNRMVLAASWEQMEMEDFIKWMRK